MNHDNNYNHRNGIHKNGRILQHKQFKERKSLLTEFSETKHFLTVKHLLYSFLFGLLIKDLIFNLILNRKVDYGLRAITFGYARFHVLFVLWCGLFTVNLLTFYAFKLWVYLRINYLNMKLWLDHIFMCLLIIYYITSLYVVPTLIKSFGLPVLSAATLAVEQVRMLMKSHSFVRRNVPDVLAYKPHSEKELFRPMLKHYIYFMFVPTLVYRHEYPRTKNISWTVAAQCFVEIIACFWLQSYVMDIFFLSKFENIGLNKHDWSYVIVVILEGVIAGCMLYILLFTMVLHNWMNFFAEVLRFGDRKFYDDWWTATNFQTFFRKWNIVVGDWLYEYIYKDFYETITPNNKVIPKVMVFLISAVAHEYILTLTAQQFFPFLFVNFFIFGMAFSFLNTKHTFYNILFLYCLSLGFSINVSFYIIEAFARRNCPIPEYNTTMSHIVPRIFSADCINGF